MAHTDFSISITDKAVEVRYSPSASQPRGKLLGLGCMIGMPIVLACAVLFLPGKYENPSMWHNWVNASYGSAGFWGPIILLTLLVGFAGVWSFYYARVAWASDEIFHCDSEAITISRVPWFDFSNRSWRTYTYPLAEVNAIRFAAIVSGRYAIWGIRFRSHGRKWALPGLAAPEAKPILVALKKYGADVPEDPKLEKRIRETLQSRDGDTSWMDRSWMGPDKQ